jgi:hypothetical protein
MPFPVEIQYIGACEQKLNVRLPAAFRTRYLVQNGGELTINDELWILHPVRDGSSRKRISRTSNDLVHETKIARGWRGFPPNAVALGSNGCGDSLVLIPRWEDPSELASMAYRWDHETGNCESLAELSALLPL